MCTLFYIPCIDDPPSSEATIPLSDRRCSCANLECHTAVLIKLYTENAAHIVPIPTACVPASALCFSRSMYAGTVKKKTTYMLRMNARSFCPSSRPVSR